MKLKTRYIIVKYDYFKNSYLKFSHKYPHQSDVIFTSEANRIQFATKFRFKFIAEFINKRLNKSNEEYFTYYKIKEVQI
jgi:hypothetical protein